ncbi:hypothetical protein JRQ81_003350 [Phrynocephalus forsythii]|uniref:Uncharacterized protein n=1 Tax=Phrynocephalus forsythii TaxID=171643 RepID=A0A9Q1AXJ3_9SAUR|nr:hypothetical protein JRQ81_003350 [Phrynocephalus forsythii]
MLDGGAKARMQHCVPEMEALTGHFVQERRDLCKNPQSHQNHMERFVGHLRKLIFNEKKITRSRETFQSQSRIRLLLVLEVSSLRGAPP